MNAFLIGGIGLALFIDVLLLSKKAKNVPDRILTVWMSIVAFQLLLFYLYTSGSIYNYPFLLGLDRPLPLLHGVMLYLYVSFLTGQAVPKRKQTLALHFLPAGLLVLYVLPFYLLPPEQKIEVYRHHGAGYEVLNLVRRYAILVSGVGYFIWSAMLLRKHRVSVEDRFSDLRRVNLRWLQILTYGLGAIWLLYAVFQNDSIVFFGVVCFVFVIGFFGVRQTDVFAFVPPDPPAAEEREKYQKSGLSEEASAELHTELLRVMTEEALYKESDLSIDALAARLNVHPNYLSQVINQREEKHFFDFVNNYRVEEFKRLVAERKHEQFTLLALAYDSGFSSKTSFNRCFKKVTGETPSSYIATLSPKS